MMTFLCYVFGDWQLGCDSVKRITDKLVYLQIPVVVDRPVGSRLQMPLGFIGAEFTLKEPIAVTEFKARSSLTMMDYMLFGTGCTKLLAIRAIYVRYRDFYSRWQSQHLRALSNAFVFI